MNTIKLAVIGGGSSYTPELIEGIIQRVETLPVKEIYLVDVEEGLEKLSIIEGLTRRMVEKAGLDIHVVATLDRREAIRGAQFVMTQFRVGGLKARANDERIPLKYNVIGQETTGPGGFAKALRTIPVILDICRDIEELAPDAWLINFTNPAGIVTEAVLKHTNVKSMGLCNVPISMQHDVASSLNEKPEDTYISFAGLNHMVWGHKVSVNGVDRTQDAINALIENGSGSMKNIAETPFNPEFIRAINVIPCPYHRYFYLKNTMLEEEMKSAETVGTRAEQVMKTEEELFQIYADQDLREKPKQLEQRGGAHYSTVSLNLVDAIWNDRKTIHTVNTLNNGAISNIASNVSVEINAVVGSTGATPLTFGDMPDELHGLMQQVKSYESLTVEAAVTKNRAKALLALAANPFIPDATVAEQILDDILEINKLQLS